MKHAYLTFVSVAVLFISACGGGGGSNNSSSAVGGLDCGTAGTGTLMGGAMQGRALALPSFVTTMRGWGGGAITTDGINMYVANPSTNTINKIVIATGAATTVATAVGTPDGNGIINFIGMTTDGTNLFLVDSYQILKIGIATGAKTTLTNLSPVGLSFYRPAGITTDGTNLYLTDSSNWKIFKISKITGAITTFAGSGTKGTADGTGTAASFTWPGSITTDGTNLYVVDNEKIRKIVIATAAVTTLAVNRGFGTLKGIVTDGTNLYVTDNLLLQIHRVTIATGTVTTLAGKTTSTGAGVRGSADGYGSSATFRAPFDITTDGVSLYVSEAPYTQLDQWVIRRITAVGCSSTSSSNISPNPGAIGGTVTISGTNFSTTPASNTVTFFNGVNGSVTAATATSLTVIVPGGISRGPVSVSTPSGTATSAGDFNVTYESAYNWMYSQMAALDRYTTAQMSNYSTAYANAIVAGSTHTEANSAGLAAMNGGTSGGTTGGSVNCDTAWTGNQNDIQVSSLCLTACSYLNAGNTYAKSSTCAILDTTYGATATNSCTVCP